MKEKYTEFKPILLVGDSLQVMLKPVSPEFYQRLELVLKFYNEDYKVNEDQKILILISQWEDKDLMWNYTTKANDSTWLKEHLQSSSEY